MAHRLRVQHRVVVENGDFEAGWSDVVPQLVEETCAQTDGVENGELVLEIATEVKQTVRATNLPLYLQANLQMYLLAHPPRKIPAEVVKMANEMERIFLLCHSWGSSTVLSQYW